MSETNQANNIAASPGVSPAQPIQRRYNANDLKRLWTGTPNEIWLKLLAVRHGKYKSLTAAEWLDHIEKMKPEKV